MNLFVFARNGLVTPKMVKLETESRILTGGRFRFLMAPLLYVYHSDISLFGKFV